MKKLLLILVAVVTLTLAGCQQAPKGDKCITLEIVYSNEDEGIDVDDTVEVCTDAEFLIGVLEENAEELEAEFAGEDSEFGAYLAGLKGYNFTTLEMNYYWAILVNDEYGMLGISSQPVEDGDTFKFEATAW
jgi:ABC-type Zn uptake system ZnuABC Zn-binding protein ZnuA